jgi:hypothetical protein
VKQAAPQSQEIDPLAQRLAELKAKWWISQAEITGRGLYLNFPQMCYPSLT